MRCERCQKIFSPGEPRCCAPVGQPELYKTSSVLILVGGSERIYRSADEVPEGLREQVQRAALGCDSATIVIADRQGRSKIAQALQRKGATEEEPTPVEASPRNKKYLKSAAIVSLFLFTALLLAWVFAR